MNKSSKTPKCDQSGTLVDSKGTIECPGCHRLVKTFNGRISIHLKNGKRVS